MSSDLGCWLSWQQWSHFIHVCFMGDFYNRTQDSDRWWSSTRKKLKLLFKRKKKRYKNPQKHRVIKRYHSVPKYTAQLSTKDLKKQQKNPKGDEKGWIKVQPSLFKKEYGTASSLIKALSRSSGGQWARVGLSRVRQWNDEGTDAACGTCGRSEWKRK